MEYNFAAEIIFDTETKQYIGLVPGLPGAYSQAYTLDELHVQLKDVIRLCLQELTEQELRQIPSRN